MHARVITFHPTPLALRVRCRATLEQQRMMYLSGRRAWEEKLALDWRIRMSVCQRCGYSAGDHALWCSEGEP